MRAYLSACTIYRDAASYLAEWIEFHRLMGIERFFLYDNGSSDDHLDVLTPYVGDGTVVVHPWPVPFIGERGRGLALRDAFDDCLRAHRGDSRWIAFLDIDEFLFSPGGDPLPGLLPDYEEFPGLCVSRAEFGTSGHRTRPDGLVIENYVHRRHVRADDLVPVKSIVDPSRALVSLGPHTFRYREGAPVDEEGRPVDQLDSRGLKPVSWSRFRIHHYWSRSQEELAQKSLRWGSLGAARETLAVRGALYGEVDETLTAYGPAVREAIAQRAGEAQA